MTQNENVAIENNNTIMIIANAFKEKAVMPWYKGTKSLAEGKGKSAFKKAALKRLEAFEAFASEEGDPTNFAGIESLCEISRSAWSIAESAAKADPTGTTPMGGLGIGLSLSDPDLESIEIFKKSLIQAVTWAARQVANEAAQARAKAQAKAQAEEDVKSVFDDFYEGVDAWEDPESDEALLLASKTIGLRIQKFLKKELEGIQENGSGIVARAEAIVKEIRLFEGDLRQSLSERALNAVDPDGVKIWIGTAVPLLPATTARRIIENCQVRISALQSKADRTLTRLRASKGVGSIKW